MTVGFDITCHTDIGIYRQSNQDAACALTAEVWGEPICMLVLCDGMGGASMGEYASRRVITDLTEWFERELPASAGQGISLDCVRSVWMQKLVRLDKEFRDYGNMHGIKLGTTATCMLFWRDSYLLVHSGDSRAYEICWRARQLSEDQSFVWQQVKHGMLTLEEARKHPCRNVLTDCIGGSRPSVPAVTLGKLRSRAVYILCSDGLVHEVTDRELAGNLSPGRNGRIAEVHEGIVRLTELAKRRGETDNITAVGMCTVKARRKDEKEASAFLVTNKLAVYGDCSGAGDTLGEEDED